MSNVTLSPGMQFVTVAVNGDVPFERSPGPTVDGERASVAGGGGGAVTVSVALPNASPWAATTVYSVASVGAVNSWLAEVESPDCTHLASVDASLKVNVTG